MSGLLPILPQRLVDRPDFDQLVGIVAAEAGVLPQWVRKDYWVVRVLDALVRSPTIKEQFVFKGGTSLSKGWKLIDRFSEDIDLLLTGQAYGAVPGKGDCERSMKAVRAAVEEHTPLRLPPLGHLSEEEKRLYYMRARYNAHIRYPIVGGPLTKTSPSEDWILVEMGFRGGPRPMTTAPIQSYIGEYVANQAALATLSRGYASDVEPFPVPVLAPERTFVEKLLAIHTAALGDPQELQARHYYDLSQLFRGHAGVRRCLEDPSMIRGLLREVIEVSNNYYGQSLALDTINLGNSPALQPSLEIRAVLVARWRAEESLYPKGQPPLDEVLKAVAEIRNLLIAGLHGLDE